MTDYALAAHLYYSITNGAIALGMAAISLAFIVAIVKRPGKYPWLSLLFAALFATLSVSRGIKAMDAMPMPGAAELVSDMVAAILTLGLASVIWPLLKTSLSMPSYEEMEAANRKLEYWENLFETFMENSPAVAFLLDRNFNLMYINRAYEENFNIKREDILGKPHHPWASDSTSQSIRAQNEKVIVEGKPISQIIYSETGPDTEPEPWLTVKFPVHSVYDGAAIGGFSINVSDTHKVEQAHAKLAATVESSQDAIIGQDLNGIITSWNGGAEELYGYSAYEAIGRPISILVPPERQDEIPMLLDKLRRGIRVDHYETIRVTKDQRIKHVSLSLSPIRADGKITGAAVIARDITDQKHKEVQISQLNEELKARIYELAEQTAALESARDQAMEASNLKSAFVANISHELRTPLSGILGLNEMLLSSDRLKDDELQLAQMVQESAEALLNVVNDILDLSKIEAGKITLEYAPFNPVFLLQDCTRLMAPTAHQKGLNYELVMDQKMPDMVYGDASRLRQVLLNLIGNAVKFTEKGSIQVRANVKEIDREKAVMEFSVSDTGIGIAPENQRFLFMPFAQIDSSATRKFGGTGLGLTISKRFVEMMGGKIGFESKPGAGSRFWLVVSFDRQQIHEAQQVANHRISKPSVDPIPAQLSIGRKVLVVEDSGVLLKMALRQLMGLGVDADGTSFGRQAVDMALSGKYDVILMDINLPDITGLEATATIRRLEAERNLPPVPIIAMTAGAMKGDREKAIASGMNDYLAKPVALENLKRTIELWLRKTASKMSA